LNHPFVIGELALGSMKNRSTILTALDGLPRAPQATDQEVLRFIQNHAVFGFALVMSMCTCSPTLLAAGNTIMDVEEATAGCRQPPWCDSWTAALKEILNTHSC